MRASRYNVPQRSSSIWKKITPAMLLLVAVGFVLEREQGRTGLIDNWNEGISAAVVKSARSTLLPQRFHQIELTKEEQAEVFADDVEPARERVVYSGLAYGGGGGERALDVIAIQFAEQDSLLYNDWPPSPVDYAVVFDQLNRRRCKVLGVISPMSWWDAPEVYYQSLIAQIKALHYPLVLPVGVTDAGSGDAGASEVKRELYLLPSTALQGDPDLLIEVDGVMDAPDQRLGDLAGVKSAFVRLAVDHTFDKAPHGRVKIPLVASSRDGLVVGLPLACALQAERVDPSEVKVIPGSAIRWRDRWVPIDLHGCLDLSLDAAMVVESDWWPAISFVAGVGENMAGEMKVPDTRGKVVILARESAGMKLASGAEVTAAGLLVAATKEIQRGEYRYPVLVFTRLPAVWYWGLLAVVPFVTLIVLRLRLGRIVVCAVYAILLVVYFLIYSQLVISYQVLQPTMTALGMWLVGLVASMFAAQWRIWRVTTPSKTRRFNQKSKEWGMEKNNGDKSSAGE